ncbi:MAG: ShlB/FhaC/HecB family hemolysin secretion/activation protein [Cyanobacteria bacterium P01_G01_bin.54]
MDKLKAPLDLVRQWRASSAVSLPNQCPRYGLRTRLTVAQVVAERSRSASRLPQSIIFEKSPPRVGNAHPFKISGIWAIAHRLTQTLSLLLLLGSTQPLLAQQLPDLDLEPPQPLPLPEAPPNPDFVSPSLELPEFPNQCQTEIFVTEVKVIAEHPVLTEENLQPIKENYTQRSLSCAELIRLGFAVAKAYQTANYSITDAITEIPPETQTAGRGIVHVVITETRIDEIIVQGLRDQGGATLVTPELQRLKASYVRSRLPTSAPLNLNDLREALQLLGLDPTIDNLQAELRTDVTPGRSTLVVNIKEAKTLNPQFTADNDRSSSVGSESQRLGFQTNNATGNGDRLAAGFTHSEGSNGLDVSYTLPINPRNGTVGLSHSRSQSRIIEDPFSILDIESSSVTTELTLRQPLTRRIRNDQFEELALGLTLSLRDGQTSLLDIPFPLSLGAESDGTTKTTVLRFFQDYTRQSATEVLALRSQFNLGLDWFDATINQQIAGVTFIPDSRFLSWQGQAQWIKILDRNTLWLTRGRVQLADQGLLSSEQFSSGGGKTVRGYRRDLLSSDNGLEFSTEVWFPIFEFVDGSAVQLTPFFDYSLGWNSADRTEPSPNQLASVGLGLRWAKDTFTLRLDWGLPLIQVEGERDNLQENGLHFSLEWLGF